MALRIHYTYKEYKGFPAATSASKTFNCVMAGAGLIDVFIAIGVSVASASLINFLPANIVIGILTALALSVCAYRFHDFFVVKAMINSLDLSTEQKKRLLKQLLMGKYGAILTWHMYINVRMHFSN